MLTAECLTCETSLSEPGLKLSVSWNIGIRLPRIILRCRLSFQRLT